MADASRPLLPNFPKVATGSTETETVQAMSRRGLEARLDALGLEEAARAA